MTLVELMVALLLGLVTTYFISQVFAVAEGQKRTATFGSDAQVNGQMISIYAPGMNPWRYPAGTAMKIAAGSQLVIQAHYTPNGTAQQDRSYVGLKILKPEEVRQQVRYNLVANTNLQTAGEFRQLVVKQKDGVVVRLADVADVVLGAESYDEDVRFDGQTATFMGIWVLPTANSLEVMARVRADSKSSTLRLYGAFALGALIYMALALIPLFGWLLLDERLSALQLLGCGLMLAGMLMALSSDAHAQSAVGFTGGVATLAAQGVVLAAPCYYPASQADLAAYVEHLAAESPLPVFLYNMPSHTKLAFELDTLRRLLDAPNVVGLKDSSADMIYFHHVRRLTRARPDWTLLIGPEELLAESVLLGGDGGVCGGANLFPRLYVELWQAARRGEIERVNDLHDEVLQIAAALYTVARPGAAVTAGLKSVLSCWGLCGDAMAEPFRALADAERDVIRKRLANLGTRWVSRRAACPVCGGRLIEIRGKLQCSQCHAISETCCEGARERADR